MKAMKRYLKPAAAILVLGVTIAVFVRYIVQHPAALHTLAHIHPLTVVLLLGLYTLTLACLAFAQEGTLELCRTKLEHGEAFLLVSYTAIINFFGPLQSGPGFRAVYLKKKYGTKLKNYTLATLLYLGFYAGFSAILLLSGIVGWLWLLLIALVVIAVVLVAVRLQLPFIGRLAALRLGGAFKLGLATAAQVFVISLIFFVELRAVNPHIHFSQALIYSGAANFALFVSLTPGAIGFRESFLLFSKHLHHIDNTTIVNASLLDRGVYIVYLCLLLVAVLGLHAKQRLLKRAATEQSS
jgi:uncharacterized membrane protein YbhN (UPF0104 family)